MTVSGRRLLHLDKRWPQSASAIPLFREGYRCGRQCAFARLPLKSRTAQPENTRSGARAQELARNGLEFGLERVVFADGNSYNIFVRVLWNFLSHTERRIFVAEITSTSPKATSEKRSYSVAEVAEILGVSKRSVYNLCSSGELKSVRVGTKLRISKKSFDEWLDGTDIED